jgi:UDP-N-acetylglucosamine 2-epimerase (non-hydrolysing)
MNILTVVGARPNFVKIAPLVRELSRRGISYDLVHTGQHYDEALSKSFFDQLNIPSPSLYLGVGSGTHGVQTGKMMMKLEEVLMDGHYDLVLVVGDVNSTLAAALAAVKLHIPVAHIESGYRSFDMRMPEEINRVLVDRVSQILFAPTENAVLNLINEGITRNRIFLVGNIMIETLINNMDKIEAAELPDIPEKYVVLTTHRAENTDDKEVLTEILAGVESCPLPVVFPIHPRTKEKLIAFGMWEGLVSSKTVMPIEPLPYLPFQRLIKGARAVLTDSGGVQEEALIYHVPCVTLRNNTERMVTLQVGANTLVGTDSAKIRAALQQALDSNTHAWPIPAYWDDGVSRRIVDTILSHEELLSVPSSDQR